MLAIKFLLWDYFWAEFDVGGSWGQRAKSKKNTGLMMRAL
jgi:hypothetical protein